MISCARRTPRQARGEKRVAALLAAAVAEFKSEGYTAATMSGIAARARAPIGSLYQFFPSKDAMARALRARHMEDAEALWRSLAPVAGRRSTEEFVDLYVDLMLRFVHEHPAFVSLLDAPSTTLPTGPRNRLRKLLESLLILHRPRLNRVEATRISETVLNINKSLMGLYARSSPTARGWVAEEYRAVLQQYLGGRLADGRKPATRTTASDGRKSARSRVRTA